MDSMYYVERTGVHGQGVQVAGTLQECLRASWWLAYLDLDEYHYWKVIPLRHSKSQLDYNNKDNALKPMEVYRWDKSSAHKLIKINPLHFYNVM